LPDVPAGSLNPNVWGFICVYHLVVDFQKVNIIWQQRSNASQTVGALWWRIKLEFSTTRTQPYVFFENIFFVLCKTPGMFVRDKPLIIIIKRTEFENSRTSIAIQEPTITKTCMVKVFLLCMNGLGTS
jgi:hypothetical protein